MVQDTEFSDLERQVKETEEKYKKIIDFIEKTTQEIGKLTRYVIHDSNIEQTYELGLDGLTLIYDTGHNMYGGNKVVVKYGSRREPVLHLYYQGKRDTPEVNKHEHGEWEAKLEKLMDNQKELIETYKKDHKEEYEANKADENKKIDKEQESFTEFFNSRAETHAKQREREESPEYKQKEAERKYKIEIEEKAKKLRVK